MSVHPEIDAFYIPPQKGTIYNGFFLTHQKVSISCNNLYTTLLKNSNISKYHTFLVLICHVKVSAEVPSGIKTLQVDTVEPNLWKTQLMT